MNSFDIKRFGQTLRWVLSVNFRLMLLWFTGSILAVFLGEMLFQAMNGHTAPLYFIQNISQFQTMLLMLVSLIMISSVVARINEKRKREAFMMLPSSNLEKYLSLVVYSTLICIAVAFLSIVLGDSIRMAWYWISGYTGPEGNVMLTSEDGVTYYWWSSSIPTMLKNMAPVIVYDGFADYPLEFALVQSLFLYGGMLWIHSIYTLGGTLLRKYSFVGTTMFVILLITIVVRTAMTFQLTLFHSRWNNGELLGYEIGVIGWILAVAFPLLSVVNYWASFHIFKAFQLITNKWFNYDFHK